MADMQPGGGWWSRLFSPSARYSVFTLLVAGIVLGVAGLLTFDYTLHATSTNEFCSSCHQNDAAKEWRGAAPPQKPRRLAARRSQSHPPPPVAPQKGRTGK